MYRTYLEINMAEAEEEVVGFVADHLQKAHADEIFELVSKLDTLAASDDPMTHEGVLERYQLLLNLYQEQPYLLDPLIAPLLTQLISKVRSHPTHTTLSNLSFQCLSHLTKVRGYKTMLRHLPHEVSDLEPVLHLLETADDTVCVWEARYMLLLWLEILVKIPFDLSRFDGDSERKVVDRIFEISTSYLDKSDRTQEAASRVLAELVGRPDVKADFLPRIVKDNLEKLNKLERIFYLNEIHAASGVCKLLAQLFKLAKREDLLPIAAYVLEQISKADLGNSTDTLLRKMNVKLVQRIGLVFLKPRVARWRYQRGARSLAANLESTNQRPTTDDGCQGDEPEEEYDIPEQLEVVLEALLNSLKDRDTVVRWSAAKGVGRVTARLPRDLADDVITSILDTNFSMQETCDAWHGGCLALAELGRRGFLLPEKLEKVVAVVLEALVYDRPLGRHSVGSNVRDSACYVCWSFARAYEPKELLPYVQNLSAALLCLAVFDREINVRRAASAAFQENVGRQRTFPHGIDILTVVDYFAVGQRGTCYRELSVFVAKFPEYTHDLIQHLLKHRVGHWDEQIRKLTAEALGNLTPLDPQFVIEFAIPELVKRSTGDELFSRQGALYALGKINKSLLNQKTPIPAEIVASIAQIPAEINKRRSNFLRGLFGDLVRSGFNWFFENLASSQFPIESVEMAEIWRKLLDENLENLNVEIRQGAAAALGALFPYYLNLPGGQGSLESLVQTYCKRLQNASLEPQRISPALALGRIPPEFVSPTLQQSLMHAAGSRSEKDSGWAQARKDCLESLGKLSNSCQLEKIDFPAFTKCYMEALEDYTIDSRGDIGKIVRECAMHQLTKIFVEANKETPALLTVELVSEAVGKLLRQSCEKIDSTRAEAAQAMKLLIQNQLPHLEHREILKQVFVSTKVLNKDLVKYKVPESTAAAEWWDAAVPSWLWPSLIEAFPKLGALLNCETYLYNVLLGFIISAGGMTESTQKSAGDALQAHLAEISDDQSKMDHFTATLTQIFSDHLTVDRVTSPLLVVLTQLLAGNAFEIYTSDCQNLEKLLDLTIEETANKKNPKKVQAGISVLCAMLQFDSNSDLWSKAMTKVLRALCHPYPIVRRKTANELYESLLLYGCLDNHNEIVMNMLTETDWDAKPKDLKETQLEIAQRFGVDVATPRSN